MNEFGQPTPQSQPTPESSVPAPGEELRTPTLPTTPRSFDRSRIESPPPFAHYQTGRQELLPPPQMQMEVSHQMSPLGMKEQQQPPTDEESGGGGVTPAVSSWMTHEWWSRTQRLPLIAHQGAYIGLSGMERNGMSGDGLARMRQPRAEYFARASSD